MQEIVEEKMELAKNPVKNINDKKDTTFLYETSEKTYNLKEQLDRLIGPEDFHYKLESVNLVVGFIITAMLTYFFIL